MTDNTTDTLRMSMRQIVDMTPTAPSLPTVPERRGIPRPMLALASGFAAVLLFVGVGAALLTGSGTDTGTGVGGQPSTQPVATAESSIVVVFFTSEAAGQPTGPIEAALELLSDHPDIVEMMIVDTDAAEAEIRQGIPDGEELFTAGLVPSVRLRITGDDATVNNIVKYAAGLDGVAHVDAYVGDISAYPPWSFQGETSVEGGPSVSGGPSVGESSVVTTTSIAKAP